MNDRSCNVLFPGTGNPARSILAEAILNRTEEGRFRAYSAGSLPMTALDRLTPQMRLDDIGRTSD